jgi:biotin--protein ligase
VYHDEGSGEFSRGALTHALTEACRSAELAPLLAAALELESRDQLRVRRILAAEICASDAWHASTALLALPGGADRFYAARLNGAGNASILRYLEAGGAFFGVCAGAYYTSARIAFEAGTAGEIRATRELVLFAGTAQGSLHELAEPYALEHLRCAAVVTVRAAAPASGSPKLHALYWGGPEFVPDPNASYKPLLSYVMPDGREALAAVRTDIGHGRAVLSGVHAEVTGEQFPIEVSRYAADSYEHGMRVGQQLAAVDSERRQVLQQLLSALGR